MRSELLRQFLLVMSIVSILAAFSSVQAGPHLDSLTLTEMSVKNLLRTAGLLYADLTPDDIGFLEEQIQPDNAPTNMLAAVILFNHDTAGYQQTLFDYFSVPDYAKRLKGKRVTIEQQDLIRSVGKIESQLTDELKQLNLLHLFAYWYYRDRNEWFVLNKEEISAARFFRTSSLAAYLGLDEDKVLELATRIDKATLKKQLNEK